MIRTSESPLAPAASRGALVVSLLLALAGLGIALFLTRLHAQAHAGVASFCAISETVNCDKVATSRYSVALGLPVSVWGAIGDGLMAVLAAWGLRRRRPHPGWPSGLLFFTAAAALLVSIALALVSKLAIGAWCLLCIASWLTSLALSLAAWWTCRRAGVTAALGVDLLALASHPRSTLAVALGGLALLTAGAAVYPRYWDRPPPSPEQAAASAPPGVVVSYSDYLCPFCATSHGQLSQLLALRPDVKLDRRQFPLDSTCNPAVKRTVHPGACELARAGICGAEQGRAEEMDDALFGNQASRQPREALAARAGLDAKRFQACLASPETERKLAADIASALRDGVRATPTYVVGRGMYVGTLPEQALPPPADAHAR